LLTEGRQEIAFHREAADLGAGAGFTTRLYNLPPRLESGLKRQPLDFIGSHVIRSTAVAAKLFQDATSEPQQPGGVLPGLLPQPQKISDDAVSVSRLAA
jgi:hypothetical protein